MNAILIMLAMGNGDVTGTLVRDGDGFALTVQGHAVPLIPTNLRIPYDDWAKQMRGLVGKRVRVTPSKDIRIYAEKFLTAEAVKENRGP